MAKHVVIVGYGPGISSAVAERFGKEGFRVSVIGRHQERLDAGVQQLAAKGIDAAAFVGDASKPESLEQALVKARAAFGPIDVLEWTAYGSSGEKDLLAASPAALAAEFQVAVVGLLAAVRVAHNDLKETKGAVLVTNGGFAYADPQIDRFALNAGAAGLALSNAAKHKLVGLLAAQLESEGIFVGEVVVTGVVKGTAWDQGHAPAIEPATIATAFWDLYSTRTEIRARV